MIEDINKFIVLIAVGFTSFVGYYFFTGDVVKDSRTYTSSIDSNWIATRILRGDVGVENIDMWVSSIKAALKKQNIQESKENVCATIAVISQESGFSEDPKVVGLGKLSVKALNDKLMKIPFGNNIKNMLVDKGYFKRLSGVETEKDLDLIYRLMVSDVIKYFSLSDVVENGMVASIIESQNSIKTLGSMQSSVDYALSINGRKHSLQDVYNIRDYMYTIEGGVYVGTSALLDWNTNYTSKLYRFADYNAGRYSSRNAAFQKAISRLSNIELQQDGDLLLYDQGNDIRHSSVSLTEKALWIVNHKYKLGFNKASIRLDLIEEKSLSFDESALFKSISKLYHDVFSEKYVYAVVPTINLDSVKITNKFTTKRYAENTYRRYISCMK